jgi:hypothetical protein
MGRLGEVKQIRAALGFAESPCRNDLPSLLALPSYPSVTLLFTIVRAATLVFIFSLCSVQPCQYNPTKVQHRGTLQSTYVQYASYNLQYGWVADRRLR